MHNSVKNIIVFFVRFVKRKIEQKISQHRTKLSGVLCAVMP